MRLYPIVYCVTRTEQEMEAAPANAPAVYPVLELETSYTRARSRARALKETPGISLPRVLDVLDVVPGKKAMTEDLPGLYNTLISMGIEHFIGKFHVYAEGFLLEEESDES